MPYAVKVRVTVGDTEETWWLKRTHDGLRQLVHMDGDIGVWGSERYAKRMSTDTNNSHAVFSGGYSSHDARMYQDGHTSTVVKVRVVEE